MARSIARVKSRSSSICVDIQSPGQAERLQNATTCMKLEKRSPPWITSEDCSLGEKKKTDKFFVFF